MEQPIIIEIAGIEIHEPIGALTDVIVSIACYFFAYKVRKYNKTESTFIYFFLYFLTLGTATLLGGLLGHAFLYALSFAWKLPGWITSMIGIMFLERAVIEHTKILLHPMYIKVLRVINILEFIIFLSLTLYFLDFKFVEFHSGYGLMFVVLSIEGFLFLKTRNQASKNILIGIGFAAIAALIFMNKIIIHEWFNHLAASHIIMAIAAFMFYKGVKKIDIFKLKKN